MVDGRSAWEWNHTAALMMLTANINRDPKKRRPFLLRDFHPHLKRTARPISVDRLTNEIMKIAESKQRAARGAKRKVLLVPYQSRPAGAENEGNG